MRPNDLELPALLTWSPAQRRRSIATGYPVQPFAPKGNCWISSAYGQSASAGPRGPRHGRTPKCDRFGTDR